MSDLPTTQFLLQLQLDRKPPRAVLSATGTGSTGASAGSVDIALAGAPPYALGMAFTAASPGGPLMPQLRSLTALPSTSAPFDPALAGDDGVLTLEWQLRDHALDTQDSSTLRVTLSNRSNYYDADDLEIRLRAIASDGSPPGERPDGNPLLSIWPDVQSVRGIRAHDTATFDYFIATRGPRAGLYTLAVEVSYQLVYVYRERCRRTLAVASLPLRIEGGSVPPLPGQLVPPPTRSPSPDSQLEQISNPQRKLHMSEHADKDAGHGHARGRELHAIQRKIALPGGGELEVAYRLVKGSHTKPDESRGSYGFNPASKEIESYFSTSDEAAMEITLRNCSGLHLRHIFITDVHLFDAKDDGSLGLPADKERLPDGNYLFEVLPNEVYFGTLPPDEARTRYLGLVTRGVHGGDFLVRFDVRYEIVDGSAYVNLPLIVNPD
jgi:hypothetical protein